MSEGQGVAAASVPWGANVAPVGAPASSVAPAAGLVGTGESEPGGRVDAKRLETALLEARAPISRLQLVFDCPGIEAARAERQQLLSQIDDYLLPRIRQSGAPILIAMVGSTGAGKSTLLNSVVGKQVSATGIRRPTTNSPVLACHPDDVGWFAENVFLPTLPRVRQQGLAMPGRDGLLVLATSEGMPAGVALLDTPDIDSVVAAHRQFARQFLDASDLWMFVTTARRYADAALWELLKDARDRGASLGLVLSRVPPPATAQVTAHFDALLEANGLGDVRRFIVPETTVTDARLPAHVSEPVRAWMAGTAQQSDHKVAILSQTMSGVLDSFQARIPALADQAQTQLALRSELRSAADCAYAAALAELDEGIRSGWLLRGEVLARWQDFAGTGDLLRTLEMPKPGRIGRSKRHAAGSVRAQALKAALRSALESLIVSVADRAAEDALERWQSSPAGAGLLAQALAARDTEASPGAAYASLRRWEGELTWGFPGSSAALAESLPEGGAAALARSSPDLPAKAGAVVVAWQDHLLYMVQTERVVKRSIARVASFDSESVALVLTAGVLGYGAGDIAVSEGASGVSQRLLGSLFGAGLLRDIGGQARQELHSRVGLLFTEEALRFTAIVDAAGGAGETSPGDLCQAAYSLEAAR